MNLTDTEMNRTALLQTIMTQRRRFLLFAHFSHLLSRSWSLRQQDKLICHSSPQQRPRASQDLRLSLHATLESVVPAGGLGSTPPVCQLTVLSQADRMELSSPGIVAV